MKKNENKKIIVTGGAGFIGSLLCERLIADGHDVICLDNLYTGDIENIKHLVFNKHFQFMTHNVTEPFFKKAVKALYNLACQISLIHYKKDNVYIIRYEYGKECLCDIGCDVVFYRRR